MTEKEISLIDRKVSKQFYYFDIGAVSHIKCFPGICIVAFNEWRKFIFSALFLECIKNAGRLFVLCPLYRATTHWPQALISIFSISWPTWKTVIIVRHTGENRWSCWLWGGCLGAAVPMAYLAASGLRDQYLHTVLHVGFSNPVRSKFGARHGWVF